MAGSPPNFHKMDSRSACIQGVLKVKVKVKGHVIRALSWILGMSYSVIDGLVLDATMHDSEPKPWSRPLSLFNFFCVEGVMYSGRWGDRRPVLPVLDESVHTRSSYYSSGRLSVAAGGVAMLPRHRATARWSHGRWSRC